MPILSRFQMLAPTTWTGDAETNQLRKVWLSRGADFAKLAPLDRIAEVRRMYHGRVDLRQAFPWALTPLERGGFLAWLLSAGVSECGFSIHDALWFTMAQALDPTEGFAETYLFQPEWQKKHPEAMFSPVAWREYLADVDSIGPFGPWLRDVPFPATDYATQQALPHGVNVLAHYSEPSGLREEALQYVRTLASQDVPTASRDLPVGYRAGLTEPCNAMDLELHDVSLIKIGAAEKLDEIYVHAGLHPRDGVHRVVCWSWELEDFPPEAIEHASLADEVWTPSEFCANAVRKAWPGKPVYPMLPAVASPPVRSWPREHFGLKQNRFVFLFMFDATSCLERKNPFGLLRAFRQAFHREEPVDCVLKISRSKVDMKVRERLLNAANEAGATVIEGVMSREESLGLLACADAYISLHRAEGLGLSLAEAMLMGKPVIATGYSANLDFMTTETGCLVAHTMVAVGEGNIPYEPTSRWAQPDEADAARHMRWVYDHPTEAQAMGERARVHAEKLFSIEAAAERMMTRLNAIRAL
jgi:glycosyltransferase involved in cell wall biosynthesis